MLKDKIVNIKKAVDILDKNGTIIIPTETVYGIGAKANSVIGIKKIYQIKNRPPDNPLICHFSSVSQIYKFTQNQPSYLLKLISYFSPGPVSYLLKLKNNSPLKIATAGKNTVICRIPDNKKFLKIIELLNYPVCAPSANLSTKYSATNLEMLEDIIFKVDGVVKDKASFFGLESTIINCLAENQIEILRPGIIGEREIAIFLKKYNLKNIKVISKSATDIIIPGNKYKHYSPITPIYLFDYKKLNFNEENIAFLGNSLSIKKLKKTFLDKKIDFKKQNLNFINLGNNSQKIAKNLFFNFHKLDKLNVKLAYFLDLNLGSNNSFDLAISNKLQKVLLA